MGYDQRPEWVKLYADEKVACGAVFLARQGDQLFERRHGPIADEQLPCIRPHVGSDRHGLPPEEFGAAPAEARPSAERQFVGRPIERAVAAFHRMNGESVADGAICDGQRPQRCLDVAREPYVETERRDFLFQRAAVGKECVACHQRALQPVGPDKPRAHAMAFSRSRR